jgi:uncharacterized membrane protein
MKNKQVALIILGITILIFFIVLSFNSALESIVNETCSHGVSCPMYATLKFQKSLSYGFIIFLAALGGYLYFLKESVNSVKKSEEKKISKEVLDNLEGEEKQIMNLVAQNDGSIYQSDLIKQTGLTKVKVSRVLDKLEGKKLIERKRRGMTNIIIAK